MRSALKLNESVKMMRFTSGPGGVAPLAAGSSSRKPKLDFEMCSRGTSNTLDLQLAPKLF